MAGTRDPLWRDRGWWDGSSGFCCLKLVSGCFLCVCSSQEQRNFFVALSSPLSLSFPHPFPCNFLTLFLTPSLCKPQNSKGFWVRLQSFGFTPAALAQLVPVPRPSHRSGAGAVTSGLWDLVATGTRRVSLQAWQRGQDFSSRQPRNDQGLKKQLLWLSLSHSSQPDPPRTKPQC